MTMPPRRTMPPILHGVALIARGRAEGLNCFRDSIRAYWYSLLPGLGVMAAATVEGLAEGAGAAAFREIPGTLCVLLAPSVISYEMARLWGREAFWHRYIVAFNWCQWLLPVLAFVMIVGVAVVHLAGGSGQAGIRILLVGLAFYALWLNWFLARHGLALSPWRAVTLVLTVNLVTLTIILGPTLLAARLK